MSITDELRTEARGFGEHLYKSEQAHRLLAIADRIDAEHEKATSEFWTKINAVPVTDENMAERGWVRLPVDADGEYIHVGDVMEWCDSGETLTVEGIGIDVLFYIDGENAEWTAARNKRHYHAPTVEDVLTKMLEQAVGYSDAHTTVALNTIAEYAKRLKLAEGEDV